MNAIAAIRKLVFKTTQADFAASAGVAQATVSRWEAGSLQPTQHQMQHIRLSAKQRGLSWDDTWFFDVKHIVDAISADLFCESTTINPRSVQA